MASWADGPAPCPHHSARRTDPPADLPLQFPLTREQDPELPELLHLGQDLLADPEKELHLFLAENCGLRSRTDGANRSGSNLQARRWGATRIATPACGLLVINECLKKYL